MSDNEQANGLNSSFVNINNIDDLSEIETSSILSGITDDEDYIIDSDFQSTVNSNTNWTSDSESESGKSSSHLDSEDPSQPYSSTPKNAKRFNEDNDADKTPQRSQTLPTIPADTPSSRSILTNPLEFTSSSMVDSNASLKLPSVVVDSYHKSAQNSDSQNEPSTIDLSTFNGWIKSKTCEDNHHFHSSFPTYDDIKKAGILKTENIFLPSLDVVVFDTADKDDLTSYDNYISICKKLQNYTRDPINLYVNRRPQNDNWIVESFDEFMVSQVIYGNNTQIIEMRPEAVSKILKYWIKPNTLVIVSCNITLDLDNFLRSSEFRKLPILTLADTAQFARSPFSKDVYQPDFLRFYSDFTVSSGAMPAIIFEKVSYLNIPEFLKYECCVEQTILGVYIANNFEFGKLTPFNEEFINPRYPRQYKPHKPTIVSIIINYLVLLIFVTLLASVIVVLGPKYSSLSQTRLSKYPTSSVSQMLDLSTSTIETPHFEISTITQTEVVSVTTSVIIEVTTITAEPEFPIELRKEKRILTELQKEEPLEVPVENFWKFKVYMVLSEGDHDEPLGVDLVFPIAQGADHQIIYDFMERSENIEILPWYQKLSENTIQLVIPRKNRHGNVFGSFTMVSSGVRDYRYISIKYGKQENVVTETGGYISAEYKYDWEQQEFNIMGKVKNASAKLAENLFKGSTIIIDATERNFKSGVAFAQLSVRGLKNYLQNTCDSVQETFQKSENPIHEYTNFQVSEKVSSNYVVASLGIQDLEESISWFSEATAKLFTAIFGQIFIVSEDMYHDFDKMISRSWEATVLLTEKFSCNAKNFLVSSFQLTEQIFQKSSNSLLFLKDLIISKRQIFEPVSTSIKTFFESTRKRVKRSGFQVPSWDYTVSSTQKTYKRVGDTIMDSLKTIKTKTAKNLKSSKLVPMRKKGFLSSSYRLGKLKKPSFNWAFKMKSLLVKERRKGNTVWWAKMPYVRNSKRTKWSIKKFRSKVRRKRLITFLNFCMFT